MLKLITTLFFVLSVSLSAGIKESAREVLDKKSNAIVFITATVKMEISVNGKAQPPSEQQTEGLATVMNDKGLLVLALSSIDPSKQVKESIKRQVRGMPFDVKVSYKDIKVLLADGTEIPAKVLMKDEDRNIAFARIDMKHEDAKDAEFSSITFADVALPKLLDDVFAIGRLGKDMYRKPTVRTSEVASVISSPKKMILSSAAIPGTPLFDEAGKALGIAVPKGGRVVVIPAKKVKSLSAEAVKQEK